MSEIIKILKDYNKQEEFNLNNFKFSDSNDTNRMLKDLTIESAVIENKRVERIIFAEEDDEGWKRSYIPGYMVEDLSPKRLKKLESEAIKIN
jgi:hypothetical protein